MQYMNIRHGTPMKKEKNPNEFENKRKKVVQFMQDTGALHSSKVIDAFLRVPREKFVPNEYQDEAYVDEALPFSPTQTISQPTTIATMLELLEVTVGKRVLEVGSGCGYVLALLSHIVGKDGKVYGVEIARDSVESSRKKIGELGFQNVEILCGDGKKGWSGKSPFDRILVSAACAQIPEQLISQLAEKGKLVAPVGNRYTQQLVKIEKENGKMSQETSQKGYFVFVPLHD